MWSGLLENQASICLSKMNVASKGGQGNPGKEQSIT
jgi:hypothetical protein